MCLNWTNNCDNQQYKLPATYSHNYARKQERWQLPPGSDLQRPQGGKRTQTQFAWGLSALPVNPSVIYSVFTSSLPGTAGPLIVTPHTDNASYAILFSTDDKGTVEEISYIAFCKAA